MLVVLFMTNCNANKYYNGLASAVTCQALHPDEGWC